MMFVVSLSSAGFVRAEEYRMSAPIENKMRTRLSHVTRHSPGLLIFLFIAVFVCTVSGCRKSAAPDSKPLPRVEEISSGPVDLTITVDPPVIHLDRDILLTIKITAPASVDIRLPPIQDRLTGFILNGAFIKEPVAGKERIAREHCFRLTPTLADEYRIGAMAVTVVDNREQPPIETWFATRPMNFAMSPLVDGKADNTIKDILGPVWIRPLFKTVALWILAIIILIVIGALLWLISRRIHRTIQLHRMSPKERALKELGALIAKDLIRRNKIKAFYLELTMVVRRYIERAHAIRAPEQTTEEFLAAVTKNPRFSHEVVVKLRNFLQKADLVKFAAFRPNPQTVDQALVTARDYVETDEQATQQQEAIDV